MFTFQLPGGLALHIDENGSIEVRDLRDYHIVSNDTSSFVYASPNQEEASVYTHVLLHLLSKPQPRLWKATNEVTHSFTGQAEIKARSEEWAIQADPTGQQVRWKRSGPGSKSFFLRLPRETKLLQMWHTGKARQLLNDAVPGVGSDKGTELVASGEDEILFYSANTRNCFLIQFSRPGHLVIRASDVLLPAVVGTPEWEIEQDETVDPESVLANKPEIEFDQDAKIRQLTWELTWDSDEPNEEVELHLYQGIVASARHFEGRLRLHIPDVSTDFGSFFYQMVLGGLPLNLRQFDGEFLAPRCNVIQGYVPAYADAWSREEALGYGYYALLDPQAVAHLTADYIRLANKYSQDRDSTRSPVAGFFSKHLPEQAPQINDYWDDAAPEFLMLAELHHRLTGDIAFAQQYLSLYRRCAKFILGRIRPGEALPITQGTWDAQGVLIGKEPYFIAECYAGLQRFADLLIVLGEIAEAQRYRDTAAAMQAAALQDYREGGLWHSERGTFINHVDYKPPHLRSPRTESWVVSDPQAEGHPRTEFAHYETIVPIWLGLLDDEERIRESFEWIDANYTYASGRGGVTFPPFFQQTFIAFLDVEVRHRFGIPGADRLLQLILDQALVGGLPITEWQFGAYRLTGDHGWAFPSFAQTHTGRIWDNAPYLGLVLNLHYGLSYTFEGWHLADPQPFAYYPLTRLDGLQYYDAVYNLTWKGQGSIQKIEVDGEAWTSHTLNLRDGEHDVRITLASQQPGTEPTWT
ncbi:MAG: hypothetical protein GYB68_13255 [Chloroflexi bacterium]|nr:hypothetical protein [Chloroflexota bacterium]